MLKRLFDNLYLRLYFNKKKKHIFLSDFKVPVWRASLTDRDVGEFRMELPFSTGHVVGIRVVNVGEFKNGLCENVYLNIDYIKGYEAPHEYTFEEFKSIYGELLLYIRQNNGVIDIIKESNAYEFDRKREKESNSSIIHLQEV